MLNIMYQNFVQYMDKSEKNQKNSKKIYFGAYFSSF